MDQAFEEPVDRQDEHQKRDEPEQWITRLDEIASIKHHRNDHKR
jgi:hypothetical protein